MNQVGIFFPKKTMIHMQQFFPLTDSPSRTLSHKLSYSQQNFTNKELKSNNSGLKKETSC